MDKNQEKNKAYYDELYASFNIKSILIWVKDVDVFLERAVSTEASWFALYKNNFADRVKGKKVLEMGCGDGVNAAIMAALGAEVYANDISSVSGEIIEKVNTSCEFQYPIKFIEGDFLENKLDSRSFDYVIGKAFLHHLTVPIEKQFLQETARLLKKDGEARFFEPAVNNKVLDFLRWYIPVKGRPSKFSKQAFIKWKENDPHPDRSFSSEHFQNIGKEFFNEVQIFPIGTLERFSRFFKWGKSQNRFKKWALINEQFLPDKLNRSLTRSQLIIYKSPLND